MKRLYDTGDNKNIYNTDSDVSVLSITKFNEASNDFEDYFVVEENADFSFWVSATTDDGNMKFTLGDDVFEIGISNVDGEFLLDTSALPAGYTIDHDTHKNQFKITVSAEKVASINVIK